MHHPKRVTVRSGGINTTQLKMLRMMALGEDQYDMAEALNLRPTTIHTYRALLLKKLNADNSTHAVAIAYELGWLQRGTVTLPKAA